MMPEKSITIEVPPTANITYGDLQKLAMKQLAVVLDVESPEEATKQLSEVDFDVQTDGFVRYAEGDIIGVYPLYRASLRVTIRNDERGTYSGRLF